jgi:hypothetical protein
MTNMKIRAFIFAIFAAILLSGMQHAAEGQNQTTNIVYAGQYVANASGGQMTMSLAQQGNQIAGQLNGLKGYVYKISGEVNPDGTIVGVARVGQGGLYFAGVMTQAGLQMMFAEPDANGRPNQQTAKTVIFTAGAAVQQNPGLPQNPNRPQTMTPQKPKMNQQSNLPTLDQCNQAHSDCMKRCKGEWACIHKHCDPINEKCTAIKKASRGKSGNSGPSSDAELIIRDSQQRTLDATYDRWRIQDGYR